MTISTRSRGRVIFLIWYVEQAQEGLFRSSKQFGLLTLIVWLPSCSADSAWVFKRLLTHTWSWHKMSSKKEPDPIYYQSFSGPWWGNIVSVERNSPKQSNIWREQKLGARTQLSSMLKKTSAECEYSLSHHTLIFKADETFKCIASYAQHGLQILSLRYYVLIEVARRTVPKEPSGKWLEQHPQRQHSSPQFPSAGH